MERKFDLMDTKNILNLINNLTYNLEKVPVKLNKYSVDFIDRN